MTDKNMDLWNKVCTTDPQYTKKVTFGRAFTAIDPMYQVMKATEELGKVGEGWGFTIEDVKFLPTDQVAMKVRLWHGARENYIEHWGQNGLYIDNKKEKPDADCMKKATTDGITKCLSYLGFNADVFLGKFDDNKYVESLIKERGAKSKRPEAESYVKDYLLKLEKCKTFDDMYALAILNEKSLRRIQDGYADLSSALNQAIESKKAKL